MKINKSGKLLFLLLLIVTIGCSGNNSSEEVETSIPFSSLPANAQSFVNEFYKGIKITEIESDTEDEVLIYSVEFENGHKVVFSDEGEWQQVEAPTGEIIPDGIVPTPIAQYLAEYYSDYGVNEINRTGYGFKVELITGLDLMFDRFGDYIGPVSDD